jgi:hypothetical protein
VKQFDEDIVGKLELNIEEKCEDLNFYLLKKLFKV